MSNLQRLWSLRSINGIVFERQEHEVTAAFGEPERVRCNFDGEIELHYASTIYRCAFGRFVECSFPASDRLVVNGITVLDPLRWLAAREDVVDKARFRISLAAGIAYDYRDPQSGSITVFGPGRWDALVRQG